jgi:hypothetical protein
MLTFDKNIYHMYRQRVWLTAICSTLLLTAKAQLPSKAEVSAAINKMSALIRDRYVDPQQGTAIADHLNKAFAAGHFAAAKSWGQLATLTTKSLQDFSHDGHLYVRYDTAQSRALLRSEQPVNTADGSQETIGTNAGLQEKAAPDPFYYGPQPANYNYGFKSVKIGDDNIGFLQVSEINISRKSLPILDAAMTFVANTRALVIDLRNNGGGGSDTGAVFESYFLPPNTPLISFTGRTGLSSTDSTVSWLKGHRYERPVFILINGKTASAAEAFAFAMQKTGRAIIIGTASAGAANMNVWLPVNENIFISVSEMAPVWHGTKDSWEQKGIQPDHTAVTEADIKAFIRSKLATL